MQIKECIDILESFKEHNISALVAQITKKIYDFLLSDEFNPQIASYFIRINDQGIRVIDCNTRGLPFSEFTEDPDNVSQVKKLINALYHAQRAFKDLEHVDLRSSYLTGPVDVWRLYHETIDKIYDAAYLFTHLDIEISDVFDEEIHLLQSALLAVFRPNSQEQTDSADYTAVPTTESDSLVSTLLRFCIKKIQSIDAHYNPQNESVATRFKEFPLGYNIGHVTGAAIELAKPSTGSLDNNAFSRFAMRLPQYIEDLTKAIESSSSELTRIEPSLNNEQLASIKAAGLKLLADLEHLKGGHFFISLKFLKYIHIIRHIITLGMSALEQTGHFTESSQDVIRYYLAQLKYHDIPRLMSLVDKIEAHSMLKPGTLSGPLMARIKDFYACLIYYASKPVDFNAKGKELLTIEDERSVSARLKPAYQRIQKAQQSLCEIKKAQAACCAFIECLSQKEHSTLALHNLSPQSKEALKAHYKIISTLLRDINPELDERIRSSFKTRSLWTAYPKSWFSFACSFLPEKFKKLSNQCAVIAEQLDLLTRSLRKKENTFQFHIDINRQLIDSVQKGADLRLCPETQDTYSISQNADRPTQDAHAQTTADSLFLIDEPQAQISEDHLVHEHTADRADYVIKHTRLSEFIHSLRVDLQQILSVFNEPIHQELCTMQANGIPFPALHNEPLITQGKQVRAIKQLFNSFYHMEALVQQLEQLKNSSFKSVYSYHLIQAYTHLHEILRIIKALESDPHLGYIGKTLWHKAQHHWATVQAQLEPYQAAHIDIPGAQPLELNPLWYTLNAFYIIPQHIHCTRANEPMSKEALDSLQQRAKKSAAAAEAILNSAHSYVRLFLQTPNMISLYVHLKNKLREFIDTTHDAAMNKITTFHSSIILPMLLEADKAEHALGLKPGLCSDPLRAMLHEYYRGLLDSLNLSHEQHIHLMCHHSSTDQRILATKQAMMHLNTEQELLTLRFACIDTLHERLPDKMHSGLMPPIQQQALIDAYKEAKPLLVELKKTLALSYPAEKQSAQSVALDALLNEGDAIELKDIAHWVKISHAYSVGLKKTLSLSLEAHKEKKQALDHLKNTEAAAHEEFIKNYATQSFKRQVNSCSSRLVGLRYAEQEYAQALKTHLLTYQKRVTSNAQKNINASIKAQLEQLLAEYQEEHLPSYHQLEAIQISLERLDHYFIRARNNSKDPAPLAIASLKELLHDTKYSIKRRIKKIQEQAQSPEFKQALIHQTTAKRSSVRYFIECILSLLEALHLYIPEQKALLRGLEQAVTNTPTNAFLNKRYALFRPAQTAQQPQESLSISTHPTAASP